MENLKFFVTVFCIQIVSNRNLTKLDLQKMSPKHEFALYKYKGSDYRSIVLLSKCLKAINFIEKDKKAGINYLFKDQRPKKISNFYF